MVFKTKITAYLLVLMACGLIVVSAGCGKKGPPRPPVDNAAPQN